MTSVPAEGRRHENGHSRSLEISLGDFTTTHRVIPISLLGIGIGALAAVVALALSRLIGLFTNLFYFQRWSTALVSPAGHTLGVWAVLVPVAGGLVIGLMARFGSERIRGHGIPEAIEAILVNGSRVEPKLAVLKPLSSAISIGSGGPFGAEGPIIMTGGAFGSLVAQFFHLTGAERKTLLVAGAAGGMAATFASPVAAVLLAVELLLFEWKPRSLIPVTLASATAAGLRIPLMGPGPLFAAPPHAERLGSGALLGCVLLGVLAGGLSALLTLAVYTSEDAFTRLPIHWMWWPMIGGLAIGVGGLIFPQALGVGYETIDDLLQGSVSSHVILGILLVKSTIWAISLGSGTSGGVLAPLLMMGGALGGLASLGLPGEGAGFWPLVGMAAIMGGTMRSPFTGIIFAVELTHDVGMLYPLLIAVVVAYAFTVLVMRRSILTEKVSRRGLHLTREYAFDPLETLLARDAMRKNVAVVAAKTTVAELARDFPAQIQPGQHLYPVADGDGALVGVLRRRGLRKLLEERLQDPALGEGRPLGEEVHAHPVVVYPDETLRVVVDRMVETGFTQFPVVSTETPTRVLGVISLRDLLLARRLRLHEEARRERVLGKSLRRRAAAARESG